jgi:hypothetical protein
MTETKGTMLEKNQKRLVNVNPEYHCHYYSLIRRRYGGYAPPPNESSTGNQPYLVFLNFRLAKNSGLGDHPDSLDTFHVLEKYELS